ncbi:FAD-linked oxidase [Pseudonocardia sp. CNS-139]|nr:FAD-linked oxidase [Pseudonocardia sp. CNS-139]
MSKQDAAATLRQHLGDGKVRTAGPGYDAARRIWNGAVDHRPAVVVRAETAADVQAAVRAARESGLALSVRSGGHGWEGRAVRDGGLVVDMTGMAPGDRPTRRRIATAGGGATSADVADRAATYGLVPVTGTAGAVGIAGLTLGGGYGPVGGRFGLAADNLAGAEVVLADGRLVYTDPQHEPELFWALRGGGGNFGVVTALRLRLHRLERLLAGFVVFPWTQAADVFGRLDDVLAAAPDELTVQSGVLSAPDGSPAVFLSPTWSGDLADGEKAVDGVQRLGTPLVSDVGPVSYPDMLGFFDAYIVPGSHYDVRTRSLPGFGPDAVTALLAAGESRTSPLSGIVVHHFHGAAARVAQDATAFWLRREHVTVEIVAAWAPDDAGSRHRDWTDAASAALAGSAFPGAYPNMVGSAARDQVERSYGGNTARLLAAKHRFDPDGVFAATPLPTGRRLA